MSWPALNSITILGHPDAALDHVRFEAKTPVGILGQSLSLEQVNLSEPLSAFDAILSVMFEQSRLAVQKPKNVRLPKA